MRPLRLELEGFACYRSRQSIDFDGLGLFAIAGPTGSGKTTLLDGIVYALYGQVPRVGKQGVSEFVALGAPTLSALLEFEASGHTYRVARKLKKGGGTQALLERRDGQRLVPLADRVKDVDGQIGSLLGLGADTFLQSVVLPQGEFARFLKSTAGAQTAMLRDLLRLSVYETMRKAASQRAGDLTIRMQALDERVATLAGATPENLAGLDERLAAEAVRVPALEEGLRQARADLDATRSLAALWAEWRERQEQREAFEALRPRLEEFRERLLADDRAAPLLPLLDARDAAAAERAEAGEDLERAEQAALEAADVAETARASLAAAEDAAGVIPALRERVQALSEAIGEARARDEARRAAREAEEALLALEKEVARLSGSAQAARETADRTRAQAEAAEARLVGLAHDPERWRSLEALVPVDAQLGPARSRRIEAQAALDRHARDLGRAVATADATRTQLEAAQAARAVSEQRESAARAELAGAEAAHRAHLLRETLRPGEACPVCRQPAPELPPLPGPGELGPLRAALDEAEREVAAARQLEARAAGASSAAEARHEAAAARRREAADEVGRAEQAVVDLEKELALGLRPESAVRTLFDEAEKPVGELFAVALAEARDREREHRRAEEEARRARSAAEAADRDAERARAELQTARAQHDARRSVLAAHRGDAEQRALRVRAVAGDSEPEPARRDLQAEIEGLEQRLALARTRLDAARSRHARAAQEQAAARRSREEADERWQRCAQIAAEALQGCGFGSEIEVRAARISATERPRLERTLDEHEAERAVLLARLAELQPLLGDVEIDATTVEGLADAASRVEAELAAAREELGRLRQARQDLARRVEEAGLLAVQLATVRADRQRLATLAEDLRVDAFQEHLLRGTFEELVAGASSRLFELSGRYTLRTAASGDGLAVIDHDNGREPRSAETLSGGETFLASLALALELSEQVQRAAGAVRLDSLFVDEGFGTLDPETLDTVSEAIESLAAGQRLVGIITHVPELTERLPARIEVTKGPAGSSARVVRA